MGRQLGDRVKQEAVFHRRAVQSRNFLRGQGVHPPPSGLRASRRSAVAWLVRLVQCPVVPGLFSSVLDMRLSALFLVMESSEPVLSEAATCRVPAQHLAVLFRLKVCRPVTVFRPARASLAGVRPGLPPPADWRGASQVGRSAPGP